MRAQMSYITPLRMLSSQVLITTLSNYFIRAVHTCTWYYLGGVHLEGALRKQKVKQIFLAKFRVPGKDRDTTNKVKSIEK